MEGGKGRTDKVCLSICFFFDTKRAREGEREGGMEGGRAVGKLATVWLSAARRFPTLNQELLTTWSTALFTTRLPSSSPPNLLFSPASLSVDLYVCLSLSLPFSAVFVFAFPPCSSRMFSFFGHVPKIWHMNCSCQSSGRVPRPPPAMPPKRTPRTTLHHWKRAAAKEIALHYYQLQFCCRQRAAGGAGRSTNQPATYPSYPHPLAETCAAYAMCHTGQQQQQQKGKPQNWNYMFYL